MMHAGMMACFQVGSLTPSVSHGQSLCPGSVLGYLEENTAALRRGNGIPALQRPKPIGSLRSGAASSSHQVIMARRVVLLCSMLRGSQGILRTGPQISRYWRRRRWRSNPSGKCPPKWLTRATVTSTMRRAAHPSGCARCGAGAGCSAIQYQSTTGASNPLSNVQGVNHRSLGPAST